jgi:hypothetical protein
MLVGKDRCDACFLVLVNPMLVFPVLDTDTRSVPYSDRCTT